MLKLRQIDLCVRIIRGILCLLVQGYSKTPLAAHLSLDGVFNYSNPFGKQSISVAKIVFQLSRGKGKPKNGQRTRTNNFENVANY